MSKITSKNLIYDSNVPPFLARLQASNGYSDDKQNFKTIRPQKPRNLEAEAEDEPVYFDEETKHTLTKKEWLAQEKQNEEIQAEQLESQTPDNVAENDEKLAETARNFATHGSRRKKKFGKIIRTEEVENQKQDSLPSKVVTSKAVGIRKFKTSDKVKKIKKIKLSFDE